MPVQGIQQMRGIRGAVVDAVSASQKGLATLATHIDNTSLGDRINDAAELILAAKGRLILVGLGKSGHIARKLAATFSSTGTPAYFVHATEASHGDLGMISSDDVVLVLSWSGQTAELSPVLAHTKRFGLSVIGMTSGRNSILADMATVTLLLPKVAEACPHGLTPTTSTVLQLALGDALAIAMLSARGFTSDDFHALHPGGELGRQLKHSF